VAEPQASEAFALLEPLTADGAAGDDRHGRPSHFAFSHRLPSAVASSPGIDCCTMRRLSSTGVDCYRPASPGIAWHHLSSIAVP
jgi:hypothetical protein